MASVPCSVFEGTQFDGGVGERAGRVGVVTLSTDQTIGTLHTVLLALGKMEKKVQLKFLSLSCTFFPFYQVLGGQGDCDT